VSTLIWIMGLSGSGKTTTASNFVSKLRTENFDVVHLDGDDLRDALDQRSSYIQSDREKLALSYARLSQLIAIQGPVVVVSSIGLYDSVQRWLREHIKCYVEVLLDAPMELLIQRDKRGIYSQNESKMGPVVGKDFAPHFPENPDLRIQLDENISVDKCGDMVLQCFHASRLFRC